MNTTEQGSGPSELELLKNRARLLGVEFSNNIGLDTLRERVNAKIVEIDGDDAVLVQAAQPTTPAAPVPGPTNPLGSNEEAGAGFDDDIEEEPEVEEAPAPVNAPKTRLDTLADTAGFVAPQKSSSTALGGPSTVKSGKTPTLRQHMYNEQMKLVNVRIQCMDPKKADLQGEILTVANKYLGNVKHFVPFGEQTDDGWLIPNIIYKELNRRRFLSISTTKDRQTKQLKTTKRWLKEFAIEVLPLPTEAELARLAAAQAAAGSIDSTSENLL